jgi:hypothetical protein
MMRKRTRRHCSRVPENSGCLAPPLSPRRNTVAWFSALFLYVKDTTLKKSSSVIFWTMVCRKSLRNLDTGDHFTFQFP